MPHFDVGGTRAGVCSIVAYFGLATVREPPSRRSGAVSPRRDEHRSGHDLVVLASGERRVRALLVVVGVGVIALLASLAIRSRTVYGTLGFWRMPDRIGYCGRRYYRSGTVTGSPEQFVSSVSGRRRWRTIGRTYTGRPIDAVVQVDDPASVCTMTLYIPKGRNRFVEYGLSGGP